MPDPQHSLGADDVGKIRDFLTALVEDENLVFEYVKNQARFLFGDDTTPPHELTSGLSEKAKGLLLYGELARVQAIMNQANSASLWIVIWIV